tara:strand:- start:2439 stop:2714 length:276 start_codon:yes stop_codon:yes gene_type:complete
MIESITLENTNHLFLCSWNGTNCVQIHTKDTLKKEYEGTNLFDDNDWYIPNYDGLYSINDVMNELIKNQDTTSIVSKNNMTIQYIKEKEVA